MLRGSDTSVDSGHMVGLVDHALQALFETDSPMAATRSSVSGLTVWATKTIWLPSAK